MAEVDPAHKTYWKKNFQTVMVLLSIWFLVSSVLATFLAGPLNNIKLGGFKLGFWIAQQGSIYVFIVLILIYAIRMDRLDKELAESQGDSADGPKNE